MAASHFNDISLFDFEELSKFDCDKISAILNSLLNEFNCHVDDFKRKSVGNRTRTKLLETEDVDLILKALESEKSLRTQTEYLNFWIARLLLCQKTILSVGKFIEQQCRNYKIWWKKYISSDTSEVPDKRYLFRIVYEIYTAINGGCQNIGIALKDYEALHDIIDSNISLRENDFKATSRQDARIDISKRINQISSEAQKTLLENPSDSILGFTSLRTLLESYLILKIEDKIRGYVRIKDGTNRVDIQLSTQLKTKHVFYILKILFPQKLKEFDALRVKIYGMASETVHRGIPQPNYLVWGSLMFAMKELETMINDLADDDNKIGDAITFLILHQNIRWYFGY